MDWKIFQKTYGGLLATVFIVLILVLAIAPTSYIAAQKEGSLSIKTSTPGVQPPIVKPVPTTSANVKVELDLPLYSSDALRHPQRFFSGRDIKITGSFAPSSVSGVSVSSNTVSGLKLDTKKGKDGSSLVAHLPETLATGNYNIQIQTSGGIISVPLTIYGLTSQEIDAKNKIPTLAKASVLNKEKNLGCGNCHWESFLAGDPKDPGKLAFIGGGYSRATLLTTKDGWNSFAKIGLGNNYVGDPYIAYDSNGK